MTIIEIIFAILLILSCVFIIAVVLMQESKQGMSNVISGGSADNYFQKNSGRTREAQLSRATKIAAVIVFVIAIAVNLISVYWGGESDNSISSDSGIGTAGDIDLNDIGIDFVEDDSDADGEIEENVPEDTSDDAAETTAGEDNAAAEEAATGEETTAATETTTAAE